MNTALSLAKLLNGISKSLGITNQLLPILHDSKPLVDSFKSIYSLFINNNIKDLQPNKIKQIKNDNIKKTITSIKRNSPQFFI